MALQKGVITDLKKFEVNILNNVLPKNMAVLQRMFLQDMNI